MFILVISILLFSTSVSGFCDSNKREVVLAVGPVNSSEHGWLPYVYQEASGNLTGEDVELLRRVLHKLGYQFRISRMNLPEKRLKFKAGCRFDYNTHLAATYTDKRAVHYFFSNPYRQEQVYAHVLGAPQKGEKTVLKLLKAGKIGVVNMNGFYGVKFERLKKKYGDEQLVHINGTMARLNMLAKKRVDFLIGDDKHISALSLKLGFHQVTKLGKPLSSTKVHFAFSKGYFDEAFMVRFNQALAKELEVNRTENY